MIYRLGVAVTGLLLTLTLLPNPAVAGRYAKPTRVHYEDEYTEGQSMGEVEGWITGAMRCVGYHETNEAKGYPGTETEGGRDKFHCKSTRGKPLQGVAPGTTGSVYDAGDNCNIWVSRYFWLAKTLRVCASRLEYKMSASGKSFTGVAYYT